MGGRSELNSRQSRRVAMGDCSKCSCVRALCIKCVHLFMCVSVCVCVCVHLRAVCHSWPAHKALKYALSIASVTVDRVHTPTT